MSVTAVVVSTTRKKLQKQETKMGLALEAAVTDLVVMDR